MQIASRGARTRTRVATAVTAAVVLVGLLPGVAHAAPANDDFDHATAITALPFTGTAELVGATVAPDDPGCGWQPTASVWFRYTPAADGAVTFDLTGSGSAEISVFTGSRGRLDLVPGTCRSSWDEPDLVPVVGGTTYHVKVTTDWPDGDLVQLTVEDVVRPVNDDFADATTLSTLPATGFTNLAAATAQAGEPQASCVDRPGNPSAWFAFTAPRTESVVLRQSSEDYETVVAAYTGDALDALTEVSCEQYGEAVLAVTAGRTYRIQVSNPYPRPVHTRIDLAAAPALQPSFGQSALDPSTLDTVTFLDQSHDPAGEPIVRTEWSFGDGTTATGREVQHRYAVDGDHVVRMTVTSADGRTATLTRTVVVRTHDVRIASFDVPARGRAGVTRSIEVGVANDRAAAENATVTLYKGGPNGFTEVARATQYVPTRTVVFPFNYTFTPEDAAAGRVTFRAVVTLAGGVRDARPVDNEATAPATTVRSATLNGVI